jgi:hypothetical protein
MQNSLGRAGGQAGGQEGGIPSLIHSLGSVINGPLFQLLSNSLIAEIIFKKLTKT